MFDSDSWLFRIFFGVIALVIVAAIGWGIYQALFWHMSPWTDGAGHLHNEYSCKQEWVPDYTSVPQTNPYTGKTTWISVRTGQHTEEDCRYW